MSLASAGWLLATASARNRVRQLVKQPRNLVFLLCFFLYIASIGGRRWVSGTGAAGASEPSLWTVITVGVFTFFYLAWAWLMGADEAALSFTEPEVQFFFPAPISRRSLVHYKLIRLLGTALFIGPVLAIAMRRTTMYGAIGYFFAFATLTLHRMCASITRAKLLEGGASKRGRIAIGVALLAVAIAVIGSITRAFMSLPTLSGLSVSECGKALERWGADHDTAIRYALYPVVAILRVIRASTPMELLARLPAPLGILALHYVWAASTNVSFEESSAEAAEKRARQRIGGRAGAVKRGEPLFHLEAKGRPWVAIAWKNLIAGTRVSRLQLFRYAIILLAMPITFAIALRGMGDQLLLFSGGTLGFAGFIALLGPHIVHNDLRQDLEHIDILRSYPLTGRQIVLGELVSPLATVVVIEYGLLLLGGILGVFYGHGDGPMLVGFALGLALLLPVVTAGGLFVRNLLVLTLPAWAAPADQNERGIEQVGQRFLVMIGTLLALGLLFVPAGAIAFAFHWLSSWVLNGLFAMIFGGLAGLFVAVTELYAGLWVLGRAFDRFDVTAR